MSFLVKRITNPCLFDLRTFWRKNSNCSTHCTYSVRWDSIWCVIMLDFFFFFLSIPLSSLSQTHSLLNAFPTLVPFFFLKFKLYSWLSSIYVTHTLTSAKIDLVVEFSPILIAHAISVICALSLSHCFSFKTQNCLYSSQTRALYWFHRIYMLLHKNHSPPTTLLLFLSDFSHSLFLFVALSLFRRLW